MFNNDEQLVLTNEKGIKFFVSDTTHNIQNYARQRGLEGIASFIIEEPNGCRNYGLVKNGQLIAVEPALDGIGSKIDVLAMVNHFTTRKGLPE